MIHSTTNFCCVCGAVWCGAVERVREHKKERERIFGCVWGLKFKPYLRDGFRFLVDNAC